jgi:H+-transporting ATPase
MEFDLWQLLERASGVWEMVGLLTFLDPPRHDSLTTIREAEECGVSFKMITPDHLLIARNTTKQLDMGDKILTAETLPTLDIETKAKPENLGRDFGEICLAADGPLMDSHRLTQNTSISSSRIFVNCTM